MKVVWLSLVLNLLIGVASCVAAPQKAAVLPERYRDFKVYATSEPDPKDASRIVVTVQFYNEGKRALQMRARLGANRKAGFQGGGQVRPIQQLLQLLQGLRVYRATLAPHYDKAQRAVEGR